jgi:hypothetical protein
VVGAVVVDVLSGTLESTRGYASMWPIISREARFN